VQSRRNKPAAKKFFRKLLKSLRYVPRVLITDKLKSYGAAKREILSGVEHRQSRSLNNRGVSTRIVRRGSASIACRALRQRGMRGGFWRPMAPLPNTADPDDYLRSAAANRQEMGNRFTSWAEIIGTERAV
jgi:putative transposase